MIRVSVDEIEGDLGAYLQRVKQGESFILVHSNKPIAELRPIQESPTGLRRPVGLCAGDFVVPDNFDEPLPEEVLADFEGR